jgi:hypothetical protein
MKKEKKSKTKTVYIIMDLGNDEPEVWGICSTRAIAERALANYEVERYNDGQYFFDSEWEIEEHTMFCVLDKAEVLTKAGKKFKKEEQDGDYDEEGGDDE